MKVETADLVIGGLAFLATVVGIILTVRHNRRLANLAEPQSQLARGEHKDLVREQARSLTAEVRAEMVTIRSDSGEFRLRITNNGPAIARRVRMHVRDIPLKDNFDVDQVAARFPIAELRVDESVEIDAHQFLDQPYSELTLILTWDDPSGKDRQHEQIVRFS